MTVLEVEVSEKQKARGVPRAGLGGSGQLWPPVLGRCLPVGFISPRKGGSGRDGEQAGPSLLSPVPPPTLHALARSLSLYPDDE